MPPGFAQLKDITNEEKAPHTESTTTKRNLYRASAHITDIAKEHPWKTFLLEQSYEGIKTIHQRTAGVAQARQRFLHVVYAYAWLHVVYMYLCMAMKDYVALCMPM